VAIVDATIAGIALAGAAAMAGLGVYGLASSRNLLRQLLSIEVIFNAILLLVLVLMAFDAVLATSLAVILVSVVAGEVIVVVAVIIAYYRAARSLDTTSLEEEGV